MYNTCSMHPQKYEIFRCFDCKSLVCALCAEFHSHDNDSEDSSKKQTSSSSSSSSSSSPSSLSLSFTSSPSDSQISQTTRSGGDKIVTKFSINEAINILDRNTSYFTVNRDVGLLEKVKEGKFIVFYGPRSVGKTTEIYNVINKLLKENEFFPIIISLKDCFSTNNGADYWNRMIDIIKNKYKINYKGDNSFFFSNSNKSSFNNKKVLLFIDEFERLNENQKVLEFILGKFRSILHDKEFDCLWSLIGVGPFEVHFMGANTNYSSLNVSETIQCNSFSIEEVKKLFLDYEIKRVVKIDPSVIDDIYELTNGHPGLTCLCGHLIDQEISSTGKFLYEQWIECQRKLEFKSSLYLDNIMNFLTNSSDEIIKKTAYNFILKFPDPIYYDNLSSELIKLISIGFIQFSIEPTGPSIKCILSSRLIQKLSKIDTQDFLKQ